MGSFTGHGHCAGIDTAPIDDAFYRSHGWTRVPTVVQLMLTTRCPMTCPHCLADAGAPGQDAPPAVIEAVLGAVAEAGVEELLLTGGEPLARGDLPDLVAALGARGISWSLNTAWSPDAAQRAAIERHPPGFVAVSLDGPASTHDAFRGVEGAHARALEAIRWFSSLDGCTVTAGTTVTRRNVRALDRTLQEVAASGAEAWGLHLLVPEGRARGRKDLALRRKDIDGILRFTARRRSVFPVAMADELGYCGEWEPLVRDLPLGCGAGRAMCVVLPDGEVVPCTTMDRSESAGNVLDRPLMEIWTEGFEGLRAGSPEGRCRGCAYASACQGGCWLQRRRGEQCFKDLWQVPGGLRTAASVAVCLGVLGTAAGFGPEGPPTAQATPPPRPPARASAAAGDTGGPPSPSSLEAQILAWYGQQIPKIEFGYRYNEINLDLQPAAPPKPPVPGAQGFLGMVRSGALPADPGERLALVRHMAATDHGSLAFGALLLRVTTEVALEAPDIESRPAALSAALGGTLEAIRREGTALRLRIFEDKLDPYLQRGRLHLRHRFEMSKAYRPPPAWLRLERDTAEERWGAPEGDRAEITKEYLARHPWGDHLGVWIRAGGGVRTEARAAGDGWRRFGPFDTLATPGSAAPIEIRVGDTPESLAVTLAPGKTFTWPDLLRAAWEQHREVLSGRLDGASVDLATPKDPLLLMAVMERMSGDDGLPSDQILLQGWLTDFWLF
jgi:radical SAM protein with 4Fe4S-binding SPASM domain